MNTEQTLQMDGIAAPNSRLNGTHINHPRTSTGSLAGATRTRARSEANRARLEQIVIVPPPRETESKVERPEPIPIPPARRVNGRRSAFRMARAVVIIGIVAATVQYVRTTLTTATSEHAYINAEIRPLRAPIGGQVIFERVVPGQAISAGALLFTVENARYGDNQATAQLAWARELAERLRAEQEEAEVRSAHQEEIYRANEKLHADQVISALALREEQSKLDLARTTVRSKARLAKQAEERVGEMEQQVELQKATSVTMPFDGTIWAAPTRNDAHIGAHEKVLEVLDREQVWVDAFFRERDARKLRVGTRVEIRTIDGASIGGGVVEWVRGGIGRVAYEGILAVSPVDYTRKRVAVRVQLDANGQFAASEFFGVGRSVVVTASKP